MFYRVYTRQVAFKYSPVRIGFKRFFHRHAINERVNEKIHIFFFFSIISNTIFFFFSFLTDNDGRQIFFIRGGRGDSQTTFFPSGAIHI